ncbi:phosphate ABC transporter permease PstA [bacterium]|nr:phosphate ABC transporter permease PstA [bacterium]
MNHPTTKSFSAASRRNRRAGGSTLLAAGEPMVWLTGGALAIALAMIVGLLSLIINEGVQTFWPKPVVWWESATGQVWMGEFDRAETPPPTAGQEEGRRRQRLRVGNFELTKSHFLWIDDDQVASRTYPEWAITAERLTGGRFFGIPVAFYEQGQSKATEPDDVWGLFVQHHEEVKRLRRQKDQLKREVVGPINRQLEEARIRLAAAKAKDEPALLESARQEMNRIESSAQEKLKSLRTELQVLDEKASSFEILFRTSTEQAYAVPLANIVRAYPANRLDSAARWRIYLDRWWEFISADPREANSEGGVFPAIIGTLCMTLLMSMAVVPFGVLAALYLKEYAQAGFIVSAVRIAINNLAGVPSIVFGVFGLGFFVYICGGSIDQAFFSLREGPVFGQGGVLWASLTLALLTLPVVIVATEEALSAVPNSMREGSYACGASKWQTIQRIILPRAMPGILTGLILAIARGAGEVAPLMLVGVLEHAPELPIDGSFPFIHPDRPFMHLGFSIYHSAFKSQNSEAARSLVFTITLLLIVLITILNLTAIAIRARLKKKYATSAF